MSALANLRERLDRLWGHVRRGTTMSPAEHRELAEGLERDHAGLRDGPSPATLSYIRSYLDSLWSQDVDYSVGEPDAVREAWAAQNELRALVGERLLPQEDLDWALEKVKP